MKRPRGDRSVTISDPRVLVRRANNRMIGVREGQKVLEIPFRDVAHLALHGPVTITGPAVAALMSHGVDISLYSGTGMFRGMITSVRSKNVHAWLAQAALWQDEPRRIELGKRIVTGKILGQYTFLKRRAWDHQRDDVMAAAEQLGRWRERLQQVETLEDLRGWEGLATAAYFKQMAKLMSPNWKFHKRARRPPPDPINSMLGYGYAIAVGEVTGAILRAGLDSRVGVVHGLRYGRESLSLDLVEEFRVPMVDRLVIRLANKRIMEPSDFERRNKGTYLTDDGKRLFLEHWERAMTGPAPAIDTNRIALGDRALRVETEHLETGTGPTWRQLITRQVSKFRRWLMHDEPYTPLEVIG